MPLSCINPTYPPMPDIKVQLPQPGGHAGAAITARAKPLLLADRCQKHHVLALATPMLSQLLKAEMAEREVRSIHCPTGDCVANAERSLSHEGRPFPGI